jgi:3-methyladenine DNA glycosylase/8-oxoguanine DNA glycosylase
LSAAALAATHRRAPRGEASDAGIELREEVRPLWPFRLPLHGGADGVLRHRDGVLHRLLHHEGRPVVVRVAQSSPDTVLFGARAGTRTAARHGIARMRFALGVDDDLRPFHERFRDDPLIGHSVRRRKHLRIRRRPEPFEALAWAICEQLIEFERAAAIQRRIVWRMGPRWNGDGVSLRDVPSAEAIAGLSPAYLQSLDLGGARARTLVRAAREVARRRIDLHAPDHERAWQRLRAIPGIGPWTVEMLALYGQGRHDQIPAGDLGFLKLVGCHLSGGDPLARAEEHQVREFFAPYGEWAGLAARHMMDGT